MGAKPTTIGGGSATGVSDDFAKMLQQAMGGGFNTGGSGAAAAGMDHMNLGDMIGQLISGGQGLANNALAIGNNRREENVGDIRSRYSMGGTGYGTPAAVGEARFLGEFDPQLAGQVGGLQMDGISKALSLLFPGLMQSQQIGTPQAQTVMKPSAFTNAVSGISQIAGIGAQFIPGHNVSGPGSNAGSAPNAAQSMASNGFINAAPSLSMGGQPGQASRYNFDGTHTLKMNSGLGNVWSGFNDPSKRNSFGQPLAW